MVGGRETAWSARQPIAAKQIRAAAVMLRCRSVIAIAMDARAHDDGFEDLREHAHFLGSKATQESPAMDFFAVRPV